MTQEEQQLSKLTWKIKSACDLGNVSWSRFDSVQENACLHACLGARLLSQSYQYPNLSEGADRVGGQLCGDKECPFSGITKSGRVWRKVPESEAQSVC